MPSEFQEIAKPGRLNVKFGRCPIWRFNSIQTEMIDLTASSTAMVSELVVDTPNFSAFFFFNLTCLLATAVYCLLRFFASHLIVGRLSFCLVALICIFYQTPLVLFSQQVEAALQNPWSYAFAVNGAVFALVLWGAWSQHVDFKEKDFSPPTNVIPIYLVTGAMALVFLSIYFMEVPWNCTGFFALLFDPWLTLLAREFSVKLIGTSVATYSLGAYANTIAPVFVLLSIWLIKNSLVNRNIIGILSGVLGGFLAIGAVLISGTKGLLIPLLIMLVVGSYFWCTTWTARFFTITSAMFFVMASIVSFELFKERSSVVGASYDFAACSANAGTCKRSLEMLDSMRHRDDSLGLPSVFVKPIQSRLVCLCDGAGDEVTCPSSTLGNTTGKRASSKTMAELSEYIAERSEYVAERSTTVIGAIINRIFVVPFRVSVWNFMYAETEPVDGAKTLPFARRLLGESLNMPELVYQKYGVAYSQGDRTSTSTAPTSFFLAYSAYLGLVGFLISFGCIIALDIILAKFAASINASLFPILAGVTLIMSVNFMVSDFFTVLISHGGAAGIALVGINALLVRRKT